MLLRSAMRAQLGRTDPSTPALQPPQLPLVRCCKQLNIAMVLLWYTLLATSRRWDLGARAPVCKAAHHCWVPL